MKFEELRQAPWAGPFSNNALRKAIEIRDAHLIGMLEIDPSLRNILAVVEASPFQHEVDIDYKIDKEGAIWINGYCDCETEFNCKHVAAAVIAALDQQPALFGAPKQTPVLETKSEAPELSRPLLQWVRKLQSATAPKNDTYSPEEKGRILYVLSLHQSVPTTLKLFLVQTRILKNGKFGSAKNCDLSIARKTSLPKFVLPIDLEIARRLMPEWRHRYASEFVLPPGMDPAILETILKTGRCHWNHHEGPQLNLGSPRPAEPSWITDPEGLQRPTFAATPPATGVLSFQSLWYLDLSDNTLGPLDTSLPRPVATVWLEAPSVSTTEALDMNRVLAQELPTLALPPAKTIELQELPPCPPRPYLRFSTTRLQWWESNVGFSAAGPNGFPLHTVEFCFDYYGLRANSFDPIAGRLEQFKDGKLQRVTRDPQSERRLVERFKSYGMAPTDECRYISTRNEFRRTWTLKRSNDSAWFHFSTHILPKLEREGWIIEYSKDFSFHVAMPTDWYGEIQPETANDWFDVELGVQVGAEKINLLPVLLNALQTKSEDLSFEKLASMSDQSPVPVPLGDGRVLPFPAGRLRDILGALIELYDPKALDRKGRLTLPRLRAAEIAALGEDKAWQWHGGETLRELGLKLKNFRGIERVKPPAALIATLRPYQQDGLSWLQFLREYNLSGILADDMGLGKTVQALAHLVAEKEHGQLDRPSLVIAPTTLMTNWRQEAERFTPNLRVLVSHGLERKQHFDKLPQFDLIITSYSLLPRDADVLLGQQYHIVMLDEAQYIKNPKTKFAQVACQLKARHQLCLTGTPMENHLGELWSLFNFLMPGFLGDEHRFRTLFRNPIEKAQDKERRRMLVRRVSPFILRRRKEDVVKELPPKTEIVQNVELNGAQRDLYETIRLAMHAKVKAEVQSKGVARSHIIILDALLKLRQVCCDPRLVPLELARHVNESAKLELLMDLLPQMIAEGRRILLFSQFTSMLELIEPELTERSIGYVKLTGDTRDRATPVNRFQSGTVPLFLISLKAGGTGLNLTAADTVIHYDPWWNPAVENQATDRAHRIGQDKKVFVYKLMTVGTVEEKILALQARKRELVDGLLNEEQKDKLQLSAEDLDVLFAPVG